jgi:hypothetical protein
MKHVRTFFARFVGVAAVVAGLLVVCPEVCHADSVELIYDEYDPISETWSYGYRFSTGGYLQPNISYWELTGAGLIEAAVGGGQGGLPWEVAELTDTRVRFVYIGPENGTGSFQTFDLVAIGPPGTVPWHSEPSTGEEPWDGHVLGPIPEPGTMSLAGLGLLVLGAMARTHVHRRSRAPHNACGVWR